MAEQVTPHPATNPADLGADPASEHPNSWADSPSLTFDHDAARPGHHIVMLPQPGAPEAVTAAVVGVLSGLQVLLGNQTDDRAADQMFGQDGAAHDVGLVVTFLAATPGPDTTTSPVSGATEALVEAIRGIIQSLALEMPHRLRCNLVRCTDPHAADVRDLLDLLAGPQGGYFLGATLDVR